MTDWDQRFLELAKHVSTWSKDSTQVGAVIARGKFVVSLGFNGFPSRLKDNDRLIIRDEKLKIILHAELNAVLSAKQNLSGCSIYVWPFPPCTQCASAIIQSGISRVVTIPSNRFNESLALFEEAGIEVLVKEDR